jgi:hypothetical protein
LSNKERRKRSIRLAERDTIRLAERDTLLMVSCRHHGCCCGVQLCAVLAADSPYPLQQLVILRSTPDLIDFLEQCLQDGVTSNASAEAPVQQCNSQHGKQERSGPRSKHRRNNNLPLQLSASQRVRREPSATAPGLFPMALLACHDYRIAMASATLPKKGYLRTQMASPGSVSVVGYVLLPCSCSSESLEVRIMIKTT